MVGIFIATVLAATYPHLATGGISTTVSLASSPTHVGTTLSMSISADETVVKTHNVWVTAYSSTPEETDDTPFVTASGGMVRDGILAANFLPFGTRVKIPALFGNKVFVVEDRMHPRKAGFVDVWMTTKSDAKRFGITRAEIAVLN